MAKTQLNRLGYYRLSNFWIFFWGSFLITLLTCCQQNENKYPNVYDLDNYQKTSINGNPDTEGLEIYVYKFDSSRKALKYFWENGNTQVVSFYFQGLKHGVWLGFYENGKKSFEKSFMFGVKNGPTKLYDSTGKIASIENYMKGALTDRTTYDTIGNVILKEKY